MIFSVMFRSSNDDASIDAPPLLQPVESSWVTFLKFAENSTADFDEALKKIQVLLCL